MGTVERCMRCSGSGSVELESDEGWWYPAYCPDCNASGWVDWCPICDGHGEIEGTQCGRCEGSGWAPAVKPAA